MLSQYIVSEIDEVYKTISNSETERMARPTTYINVTHVTQLANIQTSKLRIKTAYINMKPVNLLAYPLFDVLYALYMEIRDRDTICTNSSIGTTESTAELGYLHLERLKVQVPEITSKECCIYEIYHLANQCGISVSIDFLVSDLSTNELKYKNTDKTMDKTMDNTVINPSMVKGSVDMLTTNDPMESLLEFVWDWRYISAHPSITCEFVKASLNKPWDWYRLCDNPNLTMECVDYIIKNYLCGECEYALNYVLKMFNWLSLCENPNFTYEFIKKYWYEDMQSSDEFLMNFHKYHLFNVDSLFDFGCDYYFLLDGAEDELIREIWNTVFDHPKTNFDNIIQKLQKGRKPSMINNEYQKLECNRAVFWGNISRCIKATSNFIKNHPNYPWDVRSLYDNPNFSAEFIRELPFIKWDWDFMPHGKYFKFDIINDFNDKQWNWAIISMSQPIDTIINNMDKPWNWDYILANCKNELTPYQISKIQNRNSRPDPDNSIINPVANIVDVIEIPAEIAVRVPKPRGRNPKPCA